MTAKIVIGLLFCFFLSSTYAGNSKVYKKLNKVYQQDADKCLELSKLYLKKFPGDATPYYFITLVNKDKYMAATALTNQYGLMGQTLFYASCFDVRGKLNMKEQLSWVNTKNTIESEAQHLIQTLIANHAIDKSKKIAKKLHSLNSSYPEVPLALNPGNTSPKMADVVVNNNNKSAEEANLDAYVLKSASKNKMYFGAPSGTEFVEPFSISAEKELVAIINAERLAKGLKPLVINEKLTQAARYHAYDMATQAYFEHDSYDRVNYNLQKVTTTFERIKAFYGDSFVNSENIAAGNATALETYNQWYNSPGHKNNMFNESSSQVGIGLMYIPTSTYGYYWVFCTAK